MPVNFRVTVWPAYAARENERWVYPAGLVQVRVGRQGASTVPEELSTCTVSLSYATVVVVSAESMCSQKLKLYVEQPAGRLTAWESVSVWVRAVAVQPGVPGATVGGLAGAVLADDARAGRPDRVAGLEAGVAQLLARAGAAAADAGHGQRVAGRVRHRAGAGDRHRVRAGRGAGRGGDGQGRRAAGGHRRRAERRGRAGRQAGRGERDGLRGAAGGGGGDGRVATEPPAVTDPAVGETATEKSLPVGCRRRRCRPR